MRKGHKDNSQKSTQKMFHLWKLEKFLLNKAIFCVLINMQLISSICLVQARVYIAKQTAIYCCYALVCAFWKAICNMSKDLQNVHTF